MRQSTSGAATNGAVTNVAVLPLPVFSVFLKFYFEAISIGPPFLDQLSGCYNMETTFFQVHATLIIRLIIRYKIMFDIVPFF